MLILYVGWQEAIEKIKQRSQSDPKGRIKMARRMTEKEKECAKRLNAVIDSGDWLSGLTMSMVTGTRFSDEKLHGIVSEYGAMSGLECEGPIGASRIKKVLVR